jgi:hypothetical protein
MQGNREEKIITERGGMRGWRREVGTVKQNGSEELGS